jgi:hypothetical protein
MPLETALAQFISHPTFIGGFVVLILAVVYGIVKSTAALTRSASAFEAMRMEMVGLRQDLTNIRDDDRGEHEKTRAEVRLLREDILRQNSNGVTRAGSRPHG